MKVVGNTPGGDTVRTRASMVTGSSEDRVMTEILLKRELEPLARQRQRFKMLVALAVAWVVVAVVAFAVFAGSRYFLPLPPALLLGGIAALAVVAWVVSSKIANRSVPDFRDIARKIQTTKPDLHTLLLTAVEQERDKNTGQLGYLQERLIGDAMGAIKQEQNLSAVPARRMFAARAAAFVASHIGVVQASMKPAWPSAFAS